MVNGAWSVFFFRSQATSMVVEVLVRHVGGAKYRAGDIVVLCET
jgi:hypothetical protein